MGEKIDKLATLGQTINITSKYTEVSACQTLMTKGWLTKKF